MELQWFIRLLNSCKTESELNILMNGLKAGKGKVTKRMLDLAEAKRSQLPA